MRSLLCFLLVLNASLASLGAEPAARPAPTVLKSVDVVTNRNAAKITWLAEEGDGIDGWVVQYGTYQGLLHRTWYIRKLLEVGTREFTITDLKPGRTYSVRVYPYVAREKRISRAPTSGQVQRLEVRVGRRAEGRPAPPGELRAMSDHSRVRLTWAPSEESNVAGYEVFRKAPGQEEANPYLRLLINQVRPRVMHAVHSRWRPRLPGVSEILDSGLEEGKEYEYWVRSFTDDEPPKYSEPAGPVIVKTEPYVLKSSNVLFVLNTEAENARNIMVNYCTARGIEDPGIVRAKLPLGGWISRRDYERNLLAPVRNYLQHHQRTTIVVLVRGIPWRIGESKHSANRPPYSGWERASVDSELALARFKEYPITGRIPNPLYNKAAKLTPVDRILGVCRLDGPDDSIADDLVRRAMAAEEKGVEGIAFFDTRGLKSGSYKKGDTMILNAARIAREDGRLTVKVDNKSKVVDLSLMDQKIGFYYGWYKGSFQPKNKAFRFGRGAVGAHLHSGAGSVIEKDSRWVGEMLFYGATAVQGVAYEPLLDGFPAADALIDALLKGRNFAEASLSSARYLSWMPMNIGDPLYRPFEAKN